ncbi:MAG: helix-turn-helix domain-containing protein [Deltaproteobacteria bacterium]|nr:helix-turn-helix domain-containing protein [Deltaproteobacteria bacterium]
MGEEDLKKGHSPETEEREIGQRTGTGVGALLRTEREKQGLTREDIADATKLRRHFIEALEAEEWKELPPPVFVKGFITSYARTLHLNAREILERYERDVPTESAPHRFYVEPSKGKKWRILLILVLLGAIGVAYYLWKGYPDSKEAPVPEKALPPLIQKEQGREPPLQKQRPAEIKKEMASPVEAKPEPPPTVEVKESPGEIPPPVEEKIEVRTPEVTEVQPAPEWLVLRADIRGRTWIRICVDDKEAKEYVFQPGSRPQWEAEKGFHVIVGNAAGVEFEFNEKILKDLGTAGQVVRLSFPEGFQSSYCEE